MAKKTDSGATSSKKKLTLKQERFCQLYATRGDVFANGTQAYLEAYGLDGSDKRSYATARSASNRLLTNVAILSRVREILDLGPLSDESIDRELAFVLTQNVDFGAKISAAREINKLRGRITEKIDHTTGGKPFQPLANGMMKRKPDPIPNEDSEQ